MNMPTGRSALSAAQQRARLALRRGRYWGSDYVWIVRAIGQGLVDRDAPEGYADGWRSPVVLIPGVLEEWTVMRAIAERLHEDGHPVHVLPELRRNTATVAEAARLVAMYLESQALSDVVLVAHSKGGLIAKQVLLGETGERVRHVVAIATPFSGSVLARLIPLQMVRTLRPDDATILALAQRDDVNGKITSISPAFDPHIPGGSHLDGAINVPVEAMGHFRVLADPEVLAAVVAAAR